MEIECENHFVPLSAPHVCNCKWSIKTLLFNYGGGVSLKIDCIPKALIPNETQGTEYVRANSYRPGLA